MSAGTLWDFHEHERARLWQAKALAVGLCNDLDRLFESARDNRPGWAAHAIWVLLDRDHAHMVQQMLFKVEDLLAPAAIKWTVPSAQGLNETFEHPSAHHAARGFATAMWRVLFRCASECCPRSGATFDPSDASEALVSHHWDAVCEAVAPAVDFDCARLREDIETESNAAIERCKSTLIAAAAGEIPQPVVPSGVKHSGRSPRRKQRRRGRKPDTDTDTDRRLYEAWKTGHHSTYAELASAKGITPKDVRQAVDRHRQRIRKRRNK